MIQRIILEQFQAHKHTELELGPGVNVLTGLNNTGKSAVVEALRCLATNPPPRHVIRHGAAQARVEVVLEDGVRVAWNRKKNTAWYELWLPGQDEPEYFRKLGRGMVPDEVRDALRLDEV
ncbi:MAG: AAA family ATPase, partial [Desulfovibrio sp.]|nr:AAA family ATPase [Desulfovibrio sp.]